MKKSKVLLSLILSLALVMQMVMFVPMFAEAADYTLLYTWDIGAISASGYNGNEKIMGWYEGSGSVTNLPQSACEKLEYSTSGWNTYYTKEYNIGIGLGAGLAGPVVSANDFANGVYTIRIPIKGSSTNSALPFADGVSFSANYDGRASTVVAEIKSDDNRITLGGADTTATSDIVIGSSDNVFAMVFDNTGSVTGIDAYWGDMRIGNLTYDGKASALHRFEIDAYNNTANSDMTLEIGDIEFYQGNYYASVEPPVVEPDDPDDDGAKYTWNINNTNANNTVATEETVGVYNAGSKYWYYFGLGKIETNGPVIIDGSGTYTLKIPVDTSSNVGEFHVCANFTYGTSTDILVVENNGNIKIATGKITTDNHGNYADTGKTLSSVSSTGNNGDIIGLVINYDDSPKTITVYWNNTDLGKVEIADSVTTGSGTPYTGKLTRFQIDIPTAQYNSNTSWGNKIGDIKLYKGDLLKGLDITPSASKVLLPPEGKKVEVTFTSADVDDANEEWTVSGDSENVTFVGNVLTVTGSANPGTVEVTLTDKDSGKSTVFEYPLEKAYYDFDNISELPAGWTNASIMSDENGGYLRPNENGINYTFKNGAAGTISGRYVIDVRVKSNNVDVNADFKNAASLVQPATSSINGYTYSPKNIANEWNDIRIVYDTIKGEVSVIKGNEALQVNDTLYVYDYDRNLGRLVLGWDIDDVHIYSATTESVSVYDAYINSCAIGCNAEADYAFFAMDGSGEGESVYQWYVSNTADAEEAARELIVGATSKTYNVPNNYLGKYLWVKVKPVSEKDASLSGVDTWSEPVKVELFATNSDIKLMTTGDSPYEIYKLEIGKETTVANTAIITNNSGNSIVLMLVTALKNDGVLLDIKVNTITVNNGETKDFDASLNVTAAVGDNVVFYLWNAENLTPYSGLEAVGYTAE